MSTNEPWVAKQQETNTMYSSPAAPQPQLYTPAMYVPNTVNANSTGNLYGDPLPPPPQQSSGIPSTVVQPTPIPCSLCEARQQAGGKLEEGEPQLQPLVFNKVVSTNEYTGWRNGCGCWSTDPLVPPTCEECGITAKVTHPLVDEAEKVEAHHFWTNHPNLTFSRCNACTYKSCYKKGKKRHEKPIYFYCNRTVCSYCIQKGYHKREQSRFHHNEPAWRTPLFGCFSSPRLLCNNVMCHYTCDHPSTMWEGNLDAFDAAHLKTRVHNICSANYQHTCLCCLLLILHLPMNLVADLFCCTLSRIRDHEREVRARFGVAEHSTAQLVFCRHCVYNRLHREAEARGYPQPTFWTTKGSIPSMVAKYPPHPHHDVTPVMAPASSLLL